MPKKRFLMLFFYDLSEGCEVLSEKREVKILKCITSSGATADAPDTIKTNLRNWISFGRRLDALARVIGCGCLFFFFKISDYQ